MSRARDRGEDVAKLLVHIDVLAQARDVRRRVERLGEERAWVHLDGHAHGLRDDEDVAEDDGGVQEARVPPDGLQGYFGGELGRAADLEEAVFCAYFTELCFVSTQSDCAYCVCVKRAYREDIFPLVA